MRADDRALDYPCPRCKAMVGEPCTKTVSGRGLLELEYAHNERRSAVARANSSDVPVVEPPAAAPVDADGFVRGAAEGCSFDGTSGAPLNHAPVDRTSPATAASATLSQLPLVELECGHPASEAQAIKALQFPKADLFCFICAKYRERAS